MNPQAPVELWLRSNPLRDAEGACAINIAVTADIATVHALRHQVLRHGYLHNFGVASADDSAPGAFHLLAFLGDTPIGVCSFIPSQCPLGQGSATEIIGMAVLDRIQKSGVGTGLLQQGLALMPPGACCVWAKARCTALGFYVRQGFQPVTHMYDLLPGVPHRTVVRQIAPTQLT